MLKLSEQVRSTHNHDGGVVLDIRHGRMYGLNFVGSRILELVKQGYQDPQIAEEISRQFGVPAETASEDVLEFLRLLETKNLIQRRESGVTP